MWVTFNKVSLIQILTFKDDQILISLIQIPTFKDDQILTNPSTKWDHMPDTQYQRRQNPDVDAV